MVNMDTKYKSKIARQFQLKKIHLLTTAQIITNVLHKNVDVSQNDDDFCSVDECLNEESKTTRRNAHYKSTVLVMLYYIIYFSYCGSPPKHIGYNHVIQNLKKAKYWKLKKMMIEKLHCKDRTYNMKKVNKIKVGNYDYRPIQHYNSFKQYTYNFNMVTVIDMSMLSLIKFGYDNFNKYCREFIAINLVIKQKEKIKVDLQKKKKKKPMRYNNEETFEDNIFLEEVVLAAKNSSLEKSPLVKKYMRYSIEQLKEKLKEPSVLLKFYQAFLFECDWELLFEYLFNLLNEGFCYATMMKLLIYLICNVTKIVCIPNEREGQTRNLDIQLKQYRFKEVIRQLQIWSHKYKYSIYNLPQQDINTNIKVFDIKQFKEMARDTRKMYFFNADYALKLEIEELEFDSICLKVITFTTTNNCEKKIFDVIRITMLNTHTKVDLSSSSWLERLNKLNEIFASLNKKHEVITVGEISKRNIQYNNLNEIQYMCYYIRTCGLGVGTLFFCPSQTNNKKIRCNNMPNKRFRKLTVDDLETRMLNSNIDNTDATSTSYINLNDVTAMHDTAHSPMMQSEPLCHMITQILTQMSNNTSGLNLLKCIDENSNRSSGNNVIVAKSNSNDLMTSPIPSPKENLNISFLGDLVLNNDLQFTQFKKEDDF